MFIYEMAGASGLTCRQSYRPGSRALQGLGNWLLGAPDRADVIMLLTRHLTAVIAALTISGTAGGHSQPLTPTITCVNPASGWAWQIDIDFARATVDANPAQVSDAEISWHDAKDGGNYTLDRRSGELTVIVASSTGGYFLHDHCGLPP
jgi:hypothetical protein